MFAPSLSSRVPPAVFTGHAGGGSRSPPPASVEVGFEGHDGHVADAPAFRVWPPLALGVPLLVGGIVTATVGDPFSLSHPAVRVVGVVLCVVFVVWNGWTLAMMAANRTAVLPGGATSTILDRGPFRISRNPLYVGLIILDVGLALLWPSAWALVCVPVGVALLFWGAIVPEERYLGAKFGEEYAAYRGRVRRWI